MVGEYPNSFVLEPPTRNTLELLDSQEVPWGIVTNGSPLQMDVIKSLVLDRSAKALVVSSLVNIRKPDRTIFELVALMTSH